MMKILKALKAFMFKCVCMRMCVYTKRLKEEGNERNTEVGKLT